MIRHLRLRPGPLTPNPACTAPNAVPPPPSVPPTASTCGPANNIGAISLQENASNVVIDHVSMSWSSDEIIEYQGATDVTVQWSIVSEGMNYIENCLLYPPPSPFKCPAFAGTGTINGDLATAGLGEETKRLSFHHNAFAHNSARNPQVTIICATIPEPVDCAGDIVNNVTYNWRFNGFGIDFSNVLGHHYANAIGNYTRKGPDQATQNPGVNGLSFNDWTTNSIVIVPNAQLQLYVSGTRRFDTPTTTVDQVVRCGVWNATTNSFDVTDPCAQPSYFPATPFATPPDRDDLGRDGARGGARRCRCQRPAGGGRQPGLASAMPTTSACWTTSRTAPARSSTISRSSPAGRRSPAEPRPRTRTRTACPTRGRRISASIRGSPTTTWTPTATSTPTSRST